MREVKMTSLTVLRILEEIKKEEARHKKKMVELRREKEKAKRK